CRELNFVLPGRTPPRWNAVARWTHCSPGWRAVPWPTCASSRWVCRPPTTAFTELKHDLYPRAETPTRCAGAADRRDGAAGELPVPLGQDYPAHYRPARAAAHGTGERLARLETGGGKCAFRRPGANHAHHDGR